MEGTPMLRCPACGVDRDPAAWVRVFGVTLRPGDRCPGLLPVEVDLADGRRWAGLEQCPGTLDEGAGGGRA